MRTARLVCLVAIPLLIITLVPQVTAAQAQDWDISAYEVNVVVQDDGAIDVVESITFDLREGSFSRGERSIDTRYIEEITDIDVTSPEADIRSLGVDDGRRSTDIQWTYDEREEPVTFAVSYTAHEVVYTEDDRNVIDLQLIGDEWPVPVRNVQASILLPFPSLTEEDIDVQPRDDAAVTSSEGGWEVVYSYPELAANEGYRATLTIPPHIESREGQSLPRATSDTQIIMGVVLGLLAFLSVLGGTMWYARDPKPASIPAPASAPDISLGLAGYLALWDNLTQWRRISKALIYDLAHRGLLSLTWVKPEASWLSSSEEELHISVEAETHNLPDIERSLLNKLREYDTLQSFTTNEDGFLWEQVQAIRDELKRKGWIERHEGRGAAFAAAGVALMLLGIGAIMLLSGLPAAIGAGVGLGFGLGSLAVLLDKRLYDKTLTEAGATKREHVLSYQKQLREQIETHLEENPIEAAKIFIDEMPYLVVDLQMKTEMLKRLGEALEDHPEEIERPAWIQDQVSDAEQRDFTTFFVVFYMFYLSSISGTSSASSGTSYSGGSTGAGAVGGAGGGGGGVS